MRRRTTLLCLALVPTGALGVGVPAAGAQSARVVADPAGGPSWTAQVVPASAGGRTCTVVRRGRLGKGRFCRRLTGSTVFQYASRRETRIDPQRWRTVFVVTFARSVTRARLQTPDGDVVYRRGRGPRVLLAVFAGDVEQAPLTVEVLGRDGRRRVVRAGPPESVTVADPLDGAAWRLAPAPDSGPRRGGRTCAAWERVRPRFARFTDEQRRSEVRCGDAEEVLPVAVGERVDGRLVVIGAARADVVSLVLRGDAGSRAVERDRPNATFLAVVPGDVPAASLRVVATLRDGRRVEQALDAG